MSEGKEIVFGEFEPIKYINLPMEMVMAEESPLGITYTMMQKAVAQIVKHHDELIFDEIYKWAKENGYTDIFLIDEEFVLTAFNREIKRRRRKSWWKFWKKRN